MDFPCFLHLFLHLLGDPYSVNKPPGFAARCPEQGLPSLCWDLPSPHSPGLSCPDRELCWDREDGLAQKPYGKPSRENPIHANQGELVPSSSLPCHSAVGGSDLRPLRSGLGLFFTALFA